MLIAFGCVAFLMLAAGLYFSNVSGLVTALILVVAAIGLTTSAYVQLALTPDQRIAVLRRVHLLPAAPPDLVALTDRCGRLLEANQKFAAGSLTMIGAPNRSVQGQAWSIVWTASANAVVPAGTYGCSGEAAGVHAITARGVTTDLLR